MPSFLPIVLRPVFASWLNDRSCRLPMSVTMAILNAASCLAGVADPIEVTTSAVAAMASTASAAIRVRVYFTCPPIREMVRSLNGKTTDPNPLLGRRSRHKQIIHKLFLRTACESAFVADFGEYALIHEHAARLRAFVAGDDPAALEHVDQASRARVADAQSALQERNGSRLRLDDDLDRAIEQRVLVGVEVSVARIVFRRLDLGRDEQRLVELLRP